jgi:transcriptional regulator with XRE-family HTH domain
MTSLKADFGKIIRQLRDERKLSQDSYAAAVGFSAPTVSRWETGNTEHGPGLDQLVAAVEALGCSLDIAVHLQGGDSRVRIADAEPAEIGALEPLRTMVSQMDDRAVRELMRYAGLLLLESTLSKGETARKGQDSFKVAG